LTYTIYVVKINTVFERNVYMSIFWQFFLALWLIWSFIAVSVVMHGAAVNAEWSEESQIGKIFICGRAFVLGPIMIGFLVSCMLTIQEETLNEVTKVKP
jgi:hypothetical protein